MRSSWTLSHQAARQGKAARGHALRKRHCRRGPGAAVKPPPPTHTRGARSVPLGPLLSSRPSLRPQAHTSPFPVNTSADYRKGLSPAGELSSEPQPTPTCSARPGCGFQLPSNRSFSDNAGLLGAQLAVAPPSPPAEAPRLSLPLPRQSFCVCTSCFFTHRSHLWLQELK